MSRRLPTVGLVLRVVAAGIWLVAGAAKVADLTHFHAQVDQYRLLPSMLEAPFAYALPFVELFLGLYLLVGLLTRAAAIGACCLMVLFIIAQAQAWARGLSLDCGCFGTLTSERVGLWSIVRDLGLGLPSLVVALWPPRLLSLDRRLLGLPDLFPSISSLRLPTLGAGRESQAATETPRRARALSPTGRVPGTEDAKPDPRSGGP
jgi:uncharacterized membrane protein YphA (DoxX/SURF4 family)